MKTTAPAESRKRGPKLTPFSKHDQAHIIRELAKHQEWTGTRSKIRFRFTIAQDLFGKQIQYEYRPVPRAKLEINRSDTVAHAIEFLNRVLMHERKVAPAIQKEQNAKSKNQLSGQSAG
jgi:hypothetical protein